MDKKTAERVRNAQGAFYLQLGSQSQLAERAINGNCLMVAYPDARHSTITKNGDKGDAVKKTIDSLSKISSAKKKVLKAFYTEREAIWITAWNMRLWWTFARGGVSTQEGDTKRELKKVGTTGWSCESLRGKTLYLHDIGGVFGLGRNTVREISGDIEDDESHFSYLRNLILGEDTLSHTSGALERAKVMISRLDGGQMEWFVDKLFCDHLGWKRVSAIGSTIKDIDLAVEKKGKLAFIQVKAKSSDPANWIKIARLAHNFQRKGGSEKREVSFYFVYHSPEADFGFDSIKGWRKDAMSGRIMRKTRERYEGDIRLLTKIEKECKIPIHSWDRERLAEEVVKHKALREWLEGLVG